MISIGQLSEEDSNKQPLVLVYIYKLGHLQSLIFGVYMFKADFRGEYLSIYVSVEDLGARH